MALSLTFKQLSPPTAISASLVANSGTLEANTTYYYKIVAMEFYTNDPAVWRLVDYSVESDEVSITTNTTDLSVKLDFTPPTPLNSNYFLGYMVLRTKVQGDYSYLEPRAILSPNGNASYCTTNTGVSTYTDDGSKGLTGFINIKKGLPFIEIRSNDETVDVCTEEDLYQLFLSNGGSDFCKRINCYSDNDDRLGMQYQFTGRINCYANFKIQGGRSVVINGQFYLSSTIYTFEMGNPDNHQQGSSFGISCAGGNISNGVVAGVLKLYNSRFYSIPMDAEFQNLATAGFYFDFKKLTGSGSLASRSSEISGEIIDCIYNAEGNNNKLGGNLIVKNSILNSTGRVEDYSSFVPVLDNVTINGSEIYSYGSPYCKYKNVTLNTKSANTTVLFFHSANASASTRDLINFSCNQDTLKTNSGSNRGYVRYNLKWTASLKIKDPDLNNVDGVFISLLDNLDQSELFTDVGLKYVSYYKADTDTVLDVNDANLAKVGSYYKIGAEIVLIDSVDTTNNTITVSRKQKNTEAHILRGMRALPELLLLNEYLTTDVNGTIPIQELTEKTIVGIDGSYNTNTIDKTPHTLNLKKYGYVSQQLVISAKNKLDLGVTFLKDTFLKVDYTTASNYTGIVVDYTNKTITLNETHSMQEVYDYVSWLNVQEVNLNKKMPMIGVSENNFSLINGWVLKINTSIEGKLDITGDVELNVHDNFENYSINGALTLTIEGHYVIYSSSITKVINTSASNITLQLVNSYIGSTTGDITLDVSVPVKIKALNLIEGTTVEVYNVTDDIIIDYSKVSGSGGYTFDYNWTSDKQIRFRATYQNGVFYKKPIEVNSILTSNGLDILDVQEDWLELNSFNIDGSKVTEFDTDYVNIQIEINDPDGITQKTRLVAWYAYTITLDLGIHNFLGALIVEDEANFKVDTSKVNLKLENVGNPVVFNDNTRLYNSDGSSVIASTSNAIQMDNGKVYVTKPTPLTDSEHSHLMNIPLDKKVDVTKVNGIDVNDINDFKATVDFTETNSKIDGVASKVNTLENYNDANLTTKVNAIPTNPLLTTDVRLDNLDASISSRSTFDSAVDTVVASNMRGTDNANTVVPDNTTISNIKTKVDTLKNDVNVDKVNGISITDINDFKTSTTAIADEVEKRVLKSDIVSVKNTAVTSIDDFKEAADLSNIPSQVWSHNERKLTVQTGLTLDESNAISTIKNKVAVLENYDDTTLVNKVSDIPTNTLLKTDTRLDNLDATISSRSTFDASIDTVVASNMRGTDNANTVAPDNANIEKIKNKVNTLENYTTLHSDLDTYTNKDNFKADITSLENGVNVTKVKGAAITSIEDFKTSKIDIADEIENRVLDTNIVSVKDVGITSINDFKATVDLSNIPAYVWSYNKRDLTVQTGLTTEESSKINNIDSKVNTLENYDDSNLSAAVNAIPTNTLLVNDSRLDNLDATISSRANLNPPSQNLDDYKADLSNLPTAEQIAIDVLTKDVDEL